MVFLKIILKFFKSKKGQEIIRNIPKELVLSETDGPFTSLNNDFLYPWYTEKVIPYLGEIWECDSKECIEKLNINLSLLLKN